MVVAVVAVAFAIAVAVAVAVVDDGDKQGQSSLPFSLSLVWVSSSSLPPLDGFHWMLASHPTQIKAQAQFYPPASQQVSASLLTSAKREKLAI